MLSRISHAALGWKASLVLAAVWCASLIWVSQNPRISIFGFHAEFGRFGLVNSFGITLIRVFVGTMAALVSGISFAIVLRLLMRPLQNVALIFAFGLAVTPSPIWLTVAVMMFGLSEALPAFVVYISSVFFVIAIIIFQMQQLPERMFFCLGYLDIASSKPLATSSGHPFGVLLPLLLEWLSS